MEICNTPYAPGDHNFLHFNFKTVKDHKHQRMHLQHQE